MEVLADSPAARAHVAAKFAKDISAAGGNIDPMAENLEPAPYADYLFCDRVRVRGLVGMPTHNGRLGTCDLSHAGDYSRVRVRLDGFTKVRTRRFFSLAPGPVGSAASRVDRRRKRQKRVCDRCSSPSCSR